MAGDFIFISKDLPRRREVLAIASMTGLSHRHVVGVLIDFWTWADSETTDGKIRDCDIATIEAIFGESKTFWESMKKVGWLRENKTGIVIPRFDKWNSDSAKSRMRNTMRQRKTRDKSVTNGATKARPEVEVKERESLPLSTLEHDDDAQAVVTSLDFDSIDWGLVRLGCTKLAKSVVIRDAADRRMAIRVVALSLSVFGDGWLWTSVESTTAQKRAKPCAYLWKTLENKAKESKRNLTAIARQLDPYIPEDLLSNGSHR